MADRPGGGSPHGLVDASMSLLLDAMRDPLDPGYALAADRRVTRSRAGLAVTVALALLGGLLLATAAAQLRPQVLSGARDRSRLQAEIVRRLSRADALRAENARLREQIAQAQRAALGAGATAGLADLLARLELASGEQAVVGTGLRYTVSDAPSVQQTAVGQDPREDAALAQGRVQDRDLQIVVNGLWAAGAEAIAVNGQRLTSLSAIRSAGQAILVDFRPLVPPYVIEAIGDPAQLQAGFAADLAGSYLQSIRDNYGIEVSVSSQDRLKLPGAGSLTLRNASAPTGSATTGSATRSSTPAPNGSTTEVP